MRGPLLIYVARSLCRPWLPVARQSRHARHRSAHHLDLFLWHRRLCLREGVRNNGRRGLEKGHGGRQFGVSGVSTRRASTAGKIIDTRRGSILFGSVFLLNLCLWAVSASGAVPFGTMLAILALYMLFSLPLSIAGYYLGMRHGPFSIPVKTAVIPRQVPPQPTYLNFWVSDALSTGGALGLTHKRSPRRSSAASCHLAPPSSKAFSSFHRFGHIAPTSRSGLASSFTSSRCSRRQR